MLFLKNIVALKNFDTTVKCHFGRISDTKCSLSAKIIFSHRTSFAGQRP